MFRELTSSGGGWGEWSPVCGVWAPLLPRTRDCHRRYVGVESYCYGKDDMIGVEKEASGGCLFY
jgi:hypothetical protein